MPQRVYGYDVRKNDFAIFPPASSWEVQLTTAGIKTYLRDHLRNQLVREVPVAAQAFSKASTATGMGVGFWALTRMVFASISFLGALYRGADNTDNSIVFLEEYLGRRLGRRQYLEHSATIFVMYRHGLVHTAIPKVLERPTDQLAVGWGISHDRSEHLTLLRNSAAGMAWVIVCPEQFCADLVDGLDVYTSDFDDRAKEPQLVAAFKQGFLSMATINEPSGLRVSATVRSKLDAELARL